MFMYMSVCGYMHMGAGILGDQMRVSDALEMVLDDC